MDEIEWTGKDGPIRAYAFGLDLALIRVEEICFKLSGQVKSPKWEIFNMLLFFNEAYRHNTFHYVKGGGQ